VNETLKVSDLWKAFLSRTSERIEVLRGISFSVSPGEVVAITGASGAGKSTLLHLLGGLEEPDRGIIQWVSGGKVEQRTQPGGQVGFIFQFHHLLPDLTASENVALPLLIARVEARESRRLAELSLQEMGLAQHLAQRIGELSGGEQQRVAVARALIAKPKLVLADEPTGNLDASIGDEIARSLINYGREQQAVVIIATHNQRVAQLCDRVLLLKDGKINAVVQRG
jgi:lipoprotein-releasing system ATP-binding protein